MHIEDKPDILGSIAEALGVKHLDHQLSGMSGAGPVKTVEGVAISVFTHTGGIWAGLSQ